MPTSISENKIDNYLSLCGIIVENNYYVNILQPELEALKKRYFGNHPDEPVIFHRSEIAYKKAPFNSLVNKEIKDAFDFEFLALIKKWDYCIVGVLLDKQMHINMFTNWKKNPYHYCLEVIVELYCKYLGENVGSGDVMIENRGGKEDIALKKAFLDIFENGTANITPAYIQQFITSKNIKVKPKIANIAGLQLSDLLVYPCHRYTIKHYNLIQYDKVTFSEKIIEIIKEKFFCFDGVHVGIRHLPF